MPFLASANAVKWIPVEGHSRRIKFMRSLTVLRRSWRIRNKESGKTSITEFALNMISALKLKLRIFHDSISIYCIRYLSTC